MLTRLLLADLACSVIVALDRQHSVVLPTRNTTKSQLICADPLHLGYHLGNGSGLIFGDAATLASDLKAAAPFLHQAVEFVYIARAITKMNTAIKDPDQRGEKIQIVEPTQALFLLDCDPDGIDLATERGSALNLRQNQNFATVRSCGMQPFLHLASGRSLAYPSLIWCSALERKRI